MKIVDVCNICSVNNLSRLSKLKEEFLLLGYDKLWIKEVKFPSCNVQAIHLCVTRTYHPFLVASSGRLLASLDLIKNIWSKCGSDEKFSKTDNELCKVRLEFADDGITPVRVHELAEWMTLEEKRLIWQFASGTALEQLHPRIRI